MSKQRAKNHCGDKIRHASRLDANVALSNTLGEGRIERMEPYACKFCGGWHNGHVLVDSSFVNDPICGCGHRAITHEPFPGLGCRECDCLGHREWIYRAEIVELRSSLHRAKARISWMYRTMPQAIAYALNQIYRRERAKT